MLNRKSKSFHDVEIQVSKPAPEIIQYLFKIFMMPDSTHRIDFENHIYGLLHVIPCDDNRDFPAVDKMYYWTFMKYRHLMTFENINLMLEDIEFIWEFDVSNISGIIEDEIEKEFNHFVHSYFTWISGGLNRRGFVNFTQVHSFLNATLEKSIKSSSWRSKV